MWWTGPAAAAVRGGHALDLVVPEQLAARVKLGYQRANLQVRLLLGHVDPCLGERGERGGGAVRPDEGLGRLAANCQSADVGGALDADLVQRLVRVRLEVAVTLVDEERRPLAVNARR